MINSNRTKVLYFITLFVLFIMAELFLSNTLVSFMKEGLTFSSPIFKLHYLENTGAAFNIFKDAREILIIFASSVITLIFVYVRNHLSNLSANALFWIAMLCAGTFGNLHERISIGCVRDFFELTCINFPVFNISDIMINVSVVVLIAMVIFQRSK